MTIVSLSLLVAILLRFFGGACPCALQRNRPDPRRHAHAGVGGCPLQFPVLGLGPRS